MEGLNMTTTRREVTSKTVVLEGGRYAVVRYQVACTEIVVYQALEPYTWDAKTFGSHGSTFSTRDLPAGQWGRIATRCLTPELNALPGRTEERSKAVRAYHDALYALAHGVIVKAFPEAALGRPSMGDLELVGEQLEGLV